MRLFQYVFLLFSCLLSFILQAADPQIAITNDAVIVQKQDGSVVGWGNIPTEDNSTRFTDIATPLELDDVNAVFNPLKEDKYLRLDDDNTLWVLPQADGNHHTVLSTISEDITEPALLMENVSDYSISQTHFLVLDVDGDVWGMGDNDNSQLAMEDFSAKLVTPQKLGLSGVKQVIAQTHVIYGSYRYAFFPIYDSYSLALKHDGSVWGWGRSSYLGVNAGIRTTTAPTEIINNVKTVSSSAPYTLALKNDGTVWVWGYIQIHELLSEPTQVSIDDVVAIGASYNSSTFHPRDQYSFSVALKSDDSIWTWGYNEKGMLGNGLSLRNQDTPKPVILNTLYMPEGFLGDAIEEFVALLNTHDETIKATCYIYYEDGSGFSFPLELPPEQRSSFSLKQKGVAFYRPFSIVIEPEKRITATMIHYAEGNIALGANFSLITDKQWSTSQGFFDHEGKIRNYLAGFNPHDEAVNIDLRITGFTEDFPIERQLTIQSKRRFSIKLQDYLNEQIPEQPIGAVVSADKDIVISMTHYDDNLSEGTLTIAHPSWAYRSAAVAEGWLSDSGFEVVNILNPNDEPNYIVFEKWTPETQIYEEFKSLGIRPYQQTTLVLSDFLPKKQPFAIRWDAYTAYYRHETRDKINNMMVSFNHFDLSGLNGVNFSQPARHWEFAEGFKGNGVQEFLIVQRTSNLGTDLNVKVKLYYHDGQANAELDLMIPAGEAKAALFLHTDDRIRAGQGIMYGITVDADEPIVPYFTHYDFNFGGAFALSGTGWNP